jgi:hypothetical protein
MSKNTSKKTILVAGILNRLKGDDTEALAGKIARKAVSALEGQVAALKAKLVDDENAVESAEEALAAAKYPTNLFSDNKAYVQGIVRAQENLENAIAVEAATEDSIAYFSGILAEFNSAE